MPRCLWETKKMNAGPLFTIRQLMVTDVSLMKALLTVFGEAFGDPETYGGAVPSDAYLEQLLAKKHFIAIVALKDDRVIGGLAAYELEKFERSRSEIYIYDLAVSKTHRRRGIAIALNWDALVPRAAPMSYSFKPTTVMMRQSRFTPSLARAKTCCILTSRCMIDGVAHLGAADRPPAAAVAVTHPKSREGAGPASSGGPMHWNPTAKWRVASELTAIRPSPRSLASPPRSGAGAGKMAN